MILMPKRMFSLPVPRKIDLLRFYLFSRISLIGRKLGVKQSQIIVCGYPRGGTSLFYNMLSTTVSETFSFTEFEKYYFYSIHKFGNIATKAPLDVLHLTDIDQLNIHKKKLYIFILVRDIREIVTSRHPLCPDRYFIGYDNSLWPQDREFTKWRYDAPGIMDIASAIAKVSGREDVHIIKYEDLVSNPDLIQRQIAFDTGLKFDAEFSTYHVRENRLAYKYSGRFSPKDSNLVLEGKSVTKKSPRWCKEENKKRILDQFTRCPELFDILVEYGYEKNRDWFNRFVQEM